MNHGVSRTIILWYSWNESLVWNESFTLILLIQCLPLFIFSTPTTPLYYQLSIYMKKALHAIALCPFGWDKLLQVPPFCILHLQMWVFAYSAETFCLQKAVFYPPGFNYTLNTEIIKRYDLTAEVSPATSGLKLFFLFNKQSAAFHSSFEHGCGTLNSLLGACTPILCWILKRPEGKWKYIGHVSRGVVVPALCSSNKTRDVQVRRENYWETENLWCLSCPQSLLCTWWQESIQEKCISQILGPVPVARDWTMQ